jgi:hypothetical protein
MLVLPHWLHVTVSSESVDLAGNWEAIQVGRHGAVGQTDPPTRGLFRLEERVALP